jgi:hypothetical protein
MARAEPRAVPDPPRALAAERLLHCLGSRVKGHFRTLAQARVILIQTSDLDSISKSGESR